MRKINMALTTFIVPEVYILVGDRKEYPFYSWKQREKKIPSKWKILTA